MSRALFVCIVSIAASSRCSQATPTEPISVESRLEWTSEHFTFRYPPIDRATISDTSVRLEAQRERVLQNMAVDTMPRVVVTFYADHAALEAATVAAAGVVPPWAYGLVTAEDQIHCMSPNLAEWGPYDARMSDLTHEFAHAVTLRLNARAANRPRWLWESVALYEAGQFVNPRGLGYLQTAGSPSLAALNDVSDLRIYQLGFTIAEFIVSAWGRESLRLLIMNNGDIPTALGVPAAVFESRWGAFLQTRYLANELGLTR